MRAGIALGSNLGDRLGNLQEARRHLLALHDGSGPFLCSKIYETAPVDCPPGSLPFLNAAIELSTSTPPLNLLADLQRIEIESGRSADHAFHGPRTLDLDFLYYGSLQLSHIQLTLPHKRIPSRLFVLMPLADIRPELILPTENLTIRALCEHEESRAKYPQDINFISFF
ncbi:MAG: 2-amino-4-hydroxy-6-hydroxymethyldihydropteridine diphosphokinase [Verrucomicrobia bacterium]|nr:2-amino-4-hydroxy-6-hydroxymethyldihydropteridine diphosphokinase [Verrucomicrobiota bacterium]